MRDITKNLHIAVSSWVRTRVQLHYLHVSSGLYTKRNILYHIVITLLTRMINNEISLLKQFTITGALVSKQLVPDRTYTYVVTIRIIAPGVCITFIDYCLVQTFINVCKNITQHNYILLPHSQL